MNAIEISDFYTSGAWKTSALVPSLLTGTQPTNQGSSVSVPLPASAVVANTTGATAKPIPFTPQNGTIVQQNQRWRNAVDPPAPWVSVPACKVLAPPTAPPLGLSNSIPTGDVNMRVNTAQSALRRSYRVQAFTT
jgi:hypothetical protein